MSSPAAPASKYKIAPARSGGSGRRPTTAAAKKKDATQVLKDALKAREDEAARLASEIELLKDTVGALMTENRALKERYARVALGVLALAGADGDASSGTASATAAAAAPAAASASVASAAAAAAAAAPAASRSPSSMATARAEAGSASGRSAGAGDSTGGDCDPVVTRALAADPELVVRLVERLAAERAATLSKRSALEPRVEELETRLTEQSWQLARLAARDSYCSDVVDRSLVDDSASLADVREKLSGLQQNLAMEHPLLEDPRHVPLFLLEPIAADHEQRLASLLAAEALAPPYALSKPLFKLPGNTHIKAMNPDLRSFVMHELSLERASGADWRALAERVGIGAATVDSWRRLRLPCPMSQVLAFWGDSAGATVRMLHRHLTSPQLRAVVVAKRVGDFYDVS